MRPSDVEMLNIAVSGDVGTGTTTLGWNLASTLGWQHVNAGEYFRQWHRERGIPLDQTLQIPEELDREIDALFAHDLQTRSRVVMESHLAGWLARDYDQTYKILCTADRQVMMERIAAREDWSLAEAERHSMKRTRDLTSKFERLYGVVNPYDPAFFDVTIDTTSLSAGQVLDLALKQFLSSWPGGERLAEVLRVE